jgi:hypothetical protein
MSCSFQKSKIDTKTNNASCLCMEIYEPVCGRDGKNYANRCFAECEKVKYTPGECKN